MPEITTKEKTIDELNENLDQINYKLGNFWFSFIKGLLSGFGSVLGAGLALVPQYNWSYSGFSEAGQRVAGRF
jgi:hypothetical protein